MRTGVERMELIVLRDRGRDANISSWREIENDINDTRARIGAILDQIKRQFAPRHLLKGGIDMVKDTIGGQSIRVGESLRSHPVPLVLLGVGVGWLAVSAARDSGRLGDPGGAVRERVSSAIRDAGKRAGTLAGRVRQNVALRRLKRAQPSVPQGPYPTEAAGYAYAREKSDAAMRQAMEAKAAAQGRLHAATRRAREAGSSAWKQARDYAGWTGERMHDARDGAIKIVDDYPFVIGALGLLAGAAIALALPGGHERLIGRTGERLRDKAAAVGRETQERAQHLIDRAADVAAGSPP